MPTQDINVEKCVKRVNKILIVNSGKFSESPFLESERKECKKKSTKYMRFMIIFTSFAIMD